MPQLWKSLHKHWARPSTDEEVKRSSGTTTSSAFSMLCPARTSCDRYRPSSVNIASLRAALSFRSISGKLPRKDQVQLPAMLDHRHSRHRGAFLRNWSVYSGRKVSFPDRRNLHREPDFPHPFRPAGADGREKVS